MDDPAPANASPAAVTALSPPQAAALRRARELAVELAQLAASVRAALRAQPVAAVAAPAGEGDRGLEAGELRAALGAAKRGGGCRRPRELFGPQSPRSRTISPGGPAPEPMD